MGIFGRLKDLVNSNINDLVDKAEHPEKILKQIIREIEDCIDKSRQETVSVLAQAKSLEKNVDGKAKEVKEWNNRAEIAVDSGEDDLARKALERKLTHEKELNNLQTQLDEVNTAVDQMKNNTKVLEDKLAEACARQAALAARASAAKTARDVQQQVQKLHDPSQALGKLEKFERRVEDLENQATANAELASNQDNLTEEFSRREADTAVESELAALKARKKSAE